MVLRLFRLGLVVALMAWAVEAMDLSHSAASFFQGALADWGQALAH